MIEVIACHSSCFQPIRQRADTNVYCFAWQGCLKAFRLSPLRALFRGANTDNNGHVSLLSNAPIEEKMRAEIIFNNNLRVSKTINCKGKNMRKETQS